MIRGERRRVRRRRRGGCWRTGFRCDRGDHGGDDDDDDCDGEDDDDANDDDNSGRGRYPIGGAPKILALPKLCC